MASKSNKGDKRGALPSPHGEGKSNKTMLFALLGVGGVLLLCCTCGGVGGGGWYFLRDKRQAPPDGKEGERQAKKFEELKPEFNTNGPAIAAEFVADEQASLNKYKNKLVLVEGTVIGVDAPDYFVLRGALTKKVLQPNFRLRCTVGKEAQALSTRFSKGQKVKAIGTVSSVKSSEAYVILSECTVAEIDKSETIVITAEELVKEWQANIAAARAKYKDKDAIVTGTLVEQGKGFGNHILKGTAKTNFSFGKAGGDPILPRVGQQVEVRVWFELAMLSDNHLQANSRFIISAR